MTQHVIGGMRMLPPAATDRRNRRSYFAAIVGIGVLAVAMSRAIGQGTTEPVSLPLVDERTPIADVTTKDGFRFFSGNADTVDFHTRKVSKWSGALSNYPTMYAFHKSGEVRVKVLGRNCDEDFPLTQFDDAVKRYKALLKTRGFFR
jgi:hypothetical protein